ncbi:ABC transporter ATP-binding protein [Acidisoma silvae]|uniref:ATP-binding cassette domain-containing protein n=1 Tax=Acidisoma silvae TaxID=2802396 RepID=A0A964DY14_9PROT|nr:ATP-binding cassette domain-containing protein [Acidisoma silvae]MCB8874622.1 ATP-binding cassette domain-containing protein [Acidisoma silvae]
MLLDVRNLGGKLGRPVSMTLAAGECLVISGPSGIGKSLLLRMIADLDENTGDARLNGRSRMAMPGPHWRRQVMYLAAESGWWAETVSAHMQPLPDAAAFLPRLGLRADVMDAPVSQLSTGERQRLAFIRAAIRKPAVMLLDEPTSALDPASTGLLEDEFSRLRQTGTGLIVVTHNADQAERIATRRLFMTRDGLSEAR